MKDWSRVSPGQIAMGHEVAVTTLQLAMAYAAVANDGYLIKPRLINQILNFKMEVTYNNEVSIVRQISNARK
ncbi:MAG: hypothetical protein Ct9H300mP29_4050 [Candidatus Neomarinimicrobiota bacterium]|nr:MAG: hypothetical protein Ct9H300mP29_4050 [Candidatus Neomarinimicrobiota bacterium]